MIEYFYDKEKTGDKSEDIKITDSNVINIYLDRDSCYTESERNYYKTFSSPNGFTKSQIFDLIDQTYIQCDYDLDQDSENNEDNSGNSDSSNSNYTDSDCGNSDCSNHDSDNHENKNGQIRCLQPILLLILPASEQYLVKASFAYYT